MEVLRRVLHRKDPRVFSTREAVRKARNGEGIELQNNTIAIDFSHTPSFIDPNMATGCVIVLTSDGEKGTLSHLTIDAKVKKVAKSVMSIYQMPVSVCLSGGADGISEELIENIYEEFSNRGLVLTRSSENNDLCGPFIYRRATLFSERVEVEQGGRLNKNPKDITLTFP